MMRLKVIFLVLIAYLDTNLMVLCLLCINNTVSFLGLSMSGALIVCD